MGEEIDGKSFRDVGGFLGARCVPALPSSVSVREYELGGTFNYDVYFLFFVFTLVDLNPFLAGRSNRCDRLRRGGSACLLASAISKEDQLTWY
jgi:hypothetical protein